MANRKKIALYTGLLSLLLSSSVLLTGDGFRNYLNSSYIPNTTIVSNTSTNSSNNSNNNNKNNSIQSESIDFLVSTDSSYMDNSTDNDSTDNNIKDVPVIDDENESNPSQDISQNLDFVVEKSNGITDVVETIPKESLANGNTQDKTQSTDLEPLDNTSNISGDVIIYDATFYNSLENRLTPFIEINDEFLEKYNGRRKSWVYDKGNLTENDQIIYLTFDDGPNSNTIKILNILEEYGIKGTFFVNGRSDESSFEIYRRIVNDGHSIGNHTYSHNYSKIYGSVENFLTDFYKLEDLIKKETGVEPLKIYRFPGGSSNGVSLKPGGKYMMCLIEEELALRGYKCFDWSECHSDGCQKDNNSASTIIKTENTTKYLINKYGYSINLMHDNSLTPKVLKEFIPWALDNGYEFRSMDENSATVLQSYINPNRY
jgi:peptidoglycan/xylan/chitin deacetylase (PgdA/CDA1 family)